MFPHKTLSVALAIFLVRSRQDLFLWSVPLYKTSRTERIESIQYRGESRMDLRRQRAYEPPPSRWWFCWSSIRNPVFVKITWWHGSDPISGSLSIADSPHQRVKLILWWYNLDYWLRFPGLSFLTLHRLRVSPSTWTWTLGCVGVNTIDTIWSWTRSSSGTLDRAVPPVASLALTRLRRVIEKISVDIRAYRHIGTGPAIGSLLLSYSHL